MESKPWTPKMLFVAEVERSLEHQRLHEKTILALKEKTTALLESKGNVIVHDRFTSPGKILLDLLSENVISLERIAGDEQWIETDRRLRSFTQKDESECLEILKEEIVGINRSGAVLHIYATLYGLCLMNISKTQSAWLFDSIFTPPKEKTLKLGEE